MAALPRPRCSSASCPSPRIFIPCSPYPHSAYQVFPFHHASIFHAESHSVYPHSVYGHLHAGFLHSRHIDTSKGGLYACGQVHLVACAAVGFCAGVEHAREKRARGWIRCATSTCVCVASLLPLHNLIIAISVRACQQSSTLFHLRTLYGGPRQAAVTHDNHYPRPRATTHTLVIG